MTRPSAGSDLLVTLDAALHGTHANAHPMPWLGWLVIALCRQRARQHWLASLARRRLDRQSCTEGRIPGMPEWAYHFHGRGLCLVGPNNEVLDVDFFPEDDDAQTIDPHFFARRVTGLTCKPYVEARLAHWFGSTSDVIVVALADLRRAGIIEHPSSIHVFRLTPWLEERHAEIAQLDFDDLAVQSEWSPRLGESADPDVRKRFVSWCTAHFEDRKQARMIRSLAHVLPPEVVERACYQLLLGPIDATTGAAIDALMAIQAHPNERAFATLRRMDPNVHNPYSACRMALWFFSSRVRPDLALDLIHAFSRQRKVVGFNGNPFDSEYAILALRFAPQAARPLVRQALRSNTPRSREDIAALLSVLDEPWCRAELLAAAEEANEPAAKRVLVAFLMYSTDARTRERAHSLMPAPPDFTHQGPGYTFEEVAFLNLRASLEYARERAAEIASELRPN